MRSVSVTTPLHAPAERVWERATRLEGVNHELRPLMRMTAPARLRGATIADLEPGERAGRSWLLLGGLVPFDYDDLCVVEVEAPRRFLERSRMGSMELWQHERVIEQLTPDSCQLTDVVSFTLRRPLSRLPGVAALSARMVGFIFRHRHRRLVSVHGAARPR